MSEGPPQFHSSPSTGIFQCPQCLTYRNLLSPTQNWCSACGYYFLDLPPPSISANSNISLQEMLSDFDMPAAHHYNQPAQHPLPHLLMEDYANMRQRYLSGPSNNQQNFGFFHNEQHQRNWMQRQKFASESAYEQNLEHMRSMLNTCFSAAANNQSPTESHGPRWNKQRQSPQKNRTKGRSCTRVTSASASNPVPQDQNNHRTRPPSASNLHRGEIVRSPLFHLEADFCCPPTTLDIENQSQHQWNSLPAEMWFKIGSYLDYEDRCRLALTSRRLNCLMKDNCLWRRITLQHRKNIRDQDLKSIGKLRPRQLHLMYCKAPTATLSGISWFLSQVGDNLTHLSFMGCSKGVLENDSFLLRAVDHCPNLQHIDASYAYGIRDQTVIYIAKHVSKLRSILLNGAQLITINAIRNLVKFQSGSLERLELFGCFKLNSEIFALLSACLNLRVLSFGHLHHLSASGLLELVEKLPNLASLDLRGTMKLVTDANLTQLADHCPFLEEFVLANMRAPLRECTVAEMLRRLQRLRVLDLCGLVVVGDMAMEVLAASCPDLRELDVSCSSVTELGLGHLVEKSPASLHTLRVSYCKVNSIDVFTQLVKACPKLTKLVAYGYDNIKDWSKVTEARLKEGGGNQLEIDMESSALNAGQETSVGGGNGFSGKVLRPVPLDKS